MRFHLSAAALAGVIGVHALLAQEVQPLVTRLEVVSIHVRDHAAFDAIFLLLRDDLRLPVVFGSPSKPAQKGRTLYARFSVGNAGLEPCGPYAPDAPFDEPEVVRFYGLTFRAAQTLPVALPELERRGVREGSLLWPPKNIPDPTWPRFLTVRDPSLASDRRGVSLWEIRDSPQGGEGPARQRMLESADGGALGIVRLDEVWLGGVDAAARAKWGALLAPVMMEGDVCRIGDGPALRFLPSGPIDLRAVVFKVKSRPRAAAVLREKRLLGAVAADALELDPLRTFGLRIILRD